MATIAKTQFLQLVDRLAAQYYLLLQAEQAAPTSETHAILETQTRKTASVYLEGNPVPTADVLGVQAPIHASETTYVGPSPGPEAFATRISYFTPPVGQQIDDVLLLFVTAPSATVITTPSGFTLLESENSGRNLAVYYKILTTEQTAPVSVSIARNDTSNGVNSFVRMMHLRSLEDLGLENYHIAFGSDSGDGVTNDSAEVELTTIQTSSPGLLDLLFFTAKDSGSDSPVVGGFGYSDTRELSLVESYAAPDGGVSAIAYGAQLLSGLDEEEQTVTAKDDLVAMRIVFPSLFPKYYRTRENDLLIRKRLPGSEGNYSRLILIDPEDADVKRYATLQGDHILVVLDTNGDEEITTEVRDVYRYLTSNADIAMAFEVIPLPETVLEGSSGVRQLVTPGEYSFRGGEGNQTLRIKSRRPGRRGNELTFRYLEPTPIG
jgi:hypothetical protein